MYKQDQCPDFWLIINTQANTLLNAILNNIMQNKIVKKKKKKRNKFVVDMALRTDSFRFE